MGWTISYPLKGSGYIVSTHLSFDKAQDKSSTSFRNLARDYHFKGFPELARFFISHLCAKLPYSTGSRSTIELPRNIVNADRRILSQQTIVFKLFFFKIYLGIFDKYGGIYTAYYFSFFVSLAKIDSRPTRGADEKTLILSGFF